MTRDSRGPGGARAARRCCVCAWPTTGISLGAHVVVYGICCRRHRRVDLPAALPNAAAAHSGRRRCCGIVHALIFTTFRWLPSSLRYVFVVPHPPALICSTRCIVARRSCVDFRSGQYGTPSRPLPERVRAHGQYGTPRRPLPERVQWSGLGCSPTAEVSTSVTRPRASQSVTRARASQSLTPHVHRSRSHRA